MKMPLRVRLLAPLAVIVGLAACGSEPPPPPPAQAPPAPVGPPDVYVSARGKFSLQLPGVWKGHYIATERADTTRGARFAVELKFKPDSGSKAPPLTLLVARIFSRDAWLRLERAPGAKLASKVGDLGIEVVGISLPSMNPYPPRTREAAKFDEMMIATAQGGQQIHVVPQP